MDIHHGLCVTTINALMPIGINSTVPFVAGGILKQSYLDCDLIEVY